MPVAGYLKLRDIKFKMSVFILKIRMSISVEIPLGNTTLKLKLRLKYPYSIIRPTDGFDVVKYYLASSHSVLFLTTFEFVSKKGRRKGRVRG